MPNRLINESSPYLLQHAHNPVDWYPWGEEAKEKAQNEQKLLLVSIGYAACHWCHVMERECFEDEQVAEMMNQHFVCVKVDREERPDVDKIYMDAVMLMTQRGGWPLNAFALPDGRPIYGGTYFPKEHWINVMSQLATLFQDNPAQAYEYATRLVSTMNDMDQLVKINDHSPFSRGDLDKIIDEWLPEIDFEWGGRKVNANKFPLPVNNSLLLRIGHFTKDIHVQHAVDLTLRKMAFGGIYDQLGGGFARYSVDQYWKVPHFEKMLYDNGQMVSLYAEAYQQKPNQLYKRIVYQTLEFVIRELQSPEGGFYSSLDADSEGVEGKFYVWDYQEVQDLLGADAKEFCDYYNIVPEGNWEETNVLFSLEAEPEFASRWKLDTKTLQEKLEKGRQILFEARAKRVRPALDDKIISSWNALMLKGFVDAYRVFGEKSFLDTALRNAQFLRDKVSDQGQLYRNYKNGKRSINAFQDDYAFLIDAYISLYQVTFEEEWLDLAEKHVAYLQKHFYDSQTGMFFYTSDEDPVLVRRKMENQDDVTPAANSVLANSLQSLGLLLDKQEYLDLSVQMLQNMLPSLQKSPAWHACWGQLFLRHLFPHYEVAITGPEALNIRKEFTAHYGPNRIYAGASDQSPLPILRDRFQEKSTIYVCSGNHCKLPVHHVSEALEQMA